MYIPASSKGCWLNPKGWCIGTPYHPFSTPRKIQVYILYYIHILCMLYLQTYVLVWCLFMANVGTYTIPLDPMLTQPFRAMKFLKLDIFPTKYGIPKSLKPVSLLGWVSMGDHHEWREFLGNNWAICICIDILPFLACDFFRVVQWIDEFTVYTQSGPKKEVSLLLMAEILHHLGCMKPYK